MCPFCNKKISTSIEREIGLYNHAAAGGLCFFGFCLCAPCAYLVNDLKDVRHTSRRVAGYGRAELRALRRGLVG